MSEIINAYHLDKPTDSFSMDRQKFYDEQIAIARQGGKPTKAVGIFDVMLFTQEKEMILQKRSHAKQHNARLIDKAVGGHIMHGFSPFYTAMIECVQELQVPAVVLRKEENEHFVQTLELLNRHVEAAAVLELVDNRIHIIDNIYDGERIPIAKNVWMFFGVYDGPMKPVDREASGILYYRMNDLRQEMAEAPTMFAPDLHYFLKEYGMQLEDFLKSFD